MPKKRPSNKGLKMIHRRDFLKIAGASLASAAIGNISFAAKVKNKKPNVIFVFADDWGWGDLGCYGHQSLKTPNLDKLASQGLLFTQFYVNNPVCSPSRASVMTGQYPARLGIHGHLATHDFNKERNMPDFLDPNVPTITKLFKSDGYATAHFGKWHIGGYIWPDGKGGFESAPGPEPKEYGVDEHRVVCGMGPRWDNMDGPDFWNQSSELFVDETIRFIEKNKDKPFYVNTWLLDTHAALNPTEEQMEPYAKFSSAGPSGKNHKGAMRVYYAAATNADKQIGRLLDKLDELGLADNTIVIFSSDNGPEDIHLPESSHSGVGSAGPFRGKKRSLYEGGIRTPFIIRWPNGNIPAGKIDNTTILSAIDLLPSLCSIQGIPLPQNTKLDGENMTDALLGKPQKREKPLFWEYRYPIVGDPIIKSPMLAIREGKWKLLMNPDRSRVELYDIIADPMEVDNLADRNPDVVKKLSKQLLKWQKELPPAPIDPDAGKNDYPWPKEK